jgi:fumarate reductase subunit C
MSAEGYRVPEPGYKDYVRPYPVTWWLRSRPYFLFMVREFSSLFVFLFALFLLQGVVALSRGEAAWNAWLACAVGSQGLAIGGVLTLFFVLFHSVTWFIAGAAVSPIKIGDFKVTTPMFVVGNLGLAAVVAAIIGYFTLGG